METRTEAKSGQYLSFILKDQPYAVPIGTVREINRMSEITAVPETPGCIQGVMNLRGKVIPVVNLRLRLGMPPVATTKHSCIIVIEAESGQVGMIVDAVSSVVELSQGQIEPTPTMADTAETGFVMGMGKLENQVVVLLDIVKCLSKLKFLAGPGEDETPAPGQAA